MYDSWEGHSERIVCARALSTKLLITGSTDALIKEWNLELRDSFLKSGLPQSRKIVHEVL